MANPYLNTRAWITGATSGLGRALALEMARRGADVAVSGRREDRLNEVVKQIEALGRRAFAVPCDVTDEAQVKAAADSAAAQLGGLDVAVANAGFGVGGQIIELSAADWRRQLETNVVGAALTARYATPHLAKTRGRLALVASVAAFLPTPGSGAYAASKYAVRAIGQTLAIELAPLGVSCTLIHPGFVESEIGQVDNAGEFHPEWQDKRPAKLMWKTDKAARVMADAIASRKREFVFTGHGKIGAFLGSHLPWLVHLVMTRATSARQISSGGVSDP